MYKSNCISQYLWRVTFWKIKEKGLNKKSEDFDTIWSYNYRNAYQWKQKVYACRKFFWGNQNHRSYYIKYCLAANDLQTFWYNWVGQNWEFVYCHKKLTLSIPKLKKLWSSYCLITISYNCNPIMNFFIFFLKK